jgi:hypothetical protein
VLQAEFFTDGKKPSVQQPQELRKLEQLLNMLLDTVSSVVPPTKRWAGNFKMDFCPQQQVLPQSTQD